jgi:hypothetical protein
MPVAASFMAPAPADPTPQPGVAGAGMPGPMPGGPLGCGPMPTLGAGPMAGPPPENDLSLPARDPNAFFGNVCKPPPCRPMIIVGAEAVFAIANRAPLAAPLVTTSVTTDPNASLGGLGQPGTAILNGASPIDYHTYNGVRGTAAIDLQDRCWWLLPFEFSILYASANTNNLYNSDPFGSPVITRPIFATNLGVETGYLSAFPNLIKGGAEVSSSSRVWGLEGNFIGHTLAWDYVDGQSTAFSFTAGVRYMTLNEGIQIFSTATAIDPALVTVFGGQPFDSGSTTYVNDQFATRNHFCGAQVGGRYEYQYGPFFVNLDGKIAFGGTDEVVEINGVSAVKDPVTGAAQMAMGGIQAVASNSGRFVHTVFAYLPEGNVKVGVDLGRYCRFDVGYDLMYLSNVVRPGDFISHAVDTRQVPTDVAFSPNTIGNAPIVTFRSTDFWMQSFMIGLTISY